MCDFRVTCVKTYLWSFRILKELVRDAHIVGIVSTTLDLY